MASPPLLVKERARARDFLRAMLPRKATIYMVAMRASRGGTRHTIKFLAVRKGEIANVSPFVAEILGLARDYRRHAVIINGAGEDIGKVAVCDLSYAVYGDTYTLRAEYL